jgi:hypothetical protein
MLGLVLLVFAFVLSVCACMNWPVVPRPHLGWAAFACFIAYLLFAHAGPLLAR